MRGWMWFVAATAAWAGGEAAPAQAPVEGLYVAEQMEVASALELMPEGRFRWFFSTGALDLGAEGRWRREGDAVLLDTEPAVRPPRVDFVGTGNAEMEGGLFVQVKDAAGRTPEYLSVIGDYEDGAQVSANLEPDGYRFEPSDRRIVGVRVGSEIFQFRGERVPVPTGARQMRFRFDPADLGRFDFRAARVTFGGDGLDLNLGDDSLHYRRLSAEERAAQDAAARQAQAEIEAAANEAAAAIAAADDPTSQCFDETGTVSAAQGIAACTSLLESGQLSDVDRGGAFYARGTFRNEGPDYQAAIADFDEAIRLRPDFALAYWGRADAYEYMGDFARAAAESRIAARLEPANPDVLNALCWHLGLANEDLARGREACDTALRARPDDSPTLDSRGLIGLRQQRWQDAWADYDAAIRLGPENPDLAHFHYGRGIAALRLGRTAEGQADLARALALNDLIADTYARFGIRP